MRSNRRKNWLIKRIALGFAVAAFAAPAAQASVSEQAWPGVNPSDYAATTVTASASQVGWPGVNPSDFSGTSVQAVDYGMPRAMPRDYALASGDQIEVVRAEPRGTSSDQIEVVRSKPRSIGEPQVVAASFNWDDAAIGAGVALALILLGGGAVLATRQTGREQTA
jgi:hypothetical protein